jgi:isopenicillin-N epimerase
MNLKDQFYLNPNVTFLNFGSFGACPKPVLQQYQTYQQQMEYEPVQFMLNQGPALLQESKKQLAEFIGYPNADDIVYITNPTYGTNIIARNLPLLPGDEVLSTDIEYGACDKTWSFFCDEKGAKYVKQHISLPIVSKQAFINDFWKGYTDKTKVIFISHITSMTALQLPIKEICEEAKNRGLITVVDGAHTIGQVPFNYKDYEIDFFTGACHKWLMTPKGSSFLITSPKYQHLMNPFIVSWGYKSATPGISTYLDHHQYIGTRDFTAYLTIPAAIQFMKQHNWPAISQQCTQIVHEYLPRFCQLAGTQPLAPISNEFIAQMGSIKINRTDAVAFKNKLYNEHKIEIPVFEQNGNTYIRFSYNGCNTIDDLEKLYEVLKTEGL